MTDNKKAAKNKGGEGSVLRSPRVPQSARSSVPPQPPPISPRAIEHLYAHPSHSIRSGHAPLPEYEYNVSEAEVYVHRVSPAGEPVAVIQQKTSTMASHLPSESDSVKFGRLTEDQITEFHEKGYLILSDILTDSEACKLAIWTGEVKETIPAIGIGPMPYMEIDKRGRRILTVTENFCNTHADFNSLLRSPSLLTALSQLTSEKMHLFKEKINFKQPSAGGFAPHLDAPAFVHLAKKPLTVLFVVEDMTIENGCLEVVPGSQKGDIPIGTDNCIESAWVEGREWVPVPLKAGQVMIFGSYLAHRSGDNHSPYGRAAVYGTYNPTFEGGDIHDAYYAHRRKIWPPTHERVEGERYQEGALLYGFGSPMLTVQPEARVAVAGA